MTRSPDPRASLRNALRPVAVTSAAVAVLFLGAFSAWALYAPLSSAAIAPGVVSPDSSRKTIQHLEGGIVQEILVRDGDKVTRGDVLMRLAPTQARANFSSLSRRWQRFEAQRQRLHALERAQARIAFSSALTDVNDPDYQAFLENQQALFDFQRRSLEEKNGILERRVSQFEQEIAAVNRENEGLAEQLEIVAEEIADKEILLEKQNIRKPEVLALRRVRADLRSKIASNQAIIARAEQKINELRLSLLSLKTDFQEAIAQELAKVNGELAQLEEGMATTRDVVTRTEIRAPESGIVLDLRFKTVGGIVRPGEPILDLVPADDALFIEARLAPNDINVVAIGQHARVHLTPYAARNMPALEGKLVRISPDSMTDEATRDSYYALRVQVDPESVAKLKTSIELTPGMPAEVYLVTGEQDLFSYLVAPITRSFRKAFREE